MYKCNNSFTSKAGKKYSYGDKVDSYDYDKLSLSEQTNFRKENDYFQSQMMNIAMGDMLGTGIPGGLDMDFSTLL